jgi:histidine phosphotransferase ChpT
MTEIEFAAFLVSRVCHDLVGPLGAVVNGLEVLEEERDPNLRADALKIVGSSAEQALARLQFMRLAFGAAGSAGADIELADVQQVIRPLLAGGRVRVLWLPPQAAWPKNWAKLLLNAVLIGADCLPRGGTLQIETGPSPVRLRIVAAGTGARISVETAKALAGETAITAFEVRGIQQCLACKLAQAVNARLTVAPGTGSVEILAERIG